MRNKIHSLSGASCELLPWYVGGKLSKTEIRAIEEHLPGCDACRVELPVLRAALESMQNESVSVLPPIPDAEQFLARIDQHYSGRYPNKRTWLAAAVAASVTLLASVLYWSHTMQSAAPSTEYQTVTGADSSATIDYVLLISVDEKIDALDHQAVLQTLEPVSIAGPDRSGQYRVVIRLRARSMAGLEQFREQIEAKAAISSATVVAIELPVESP